MASSADKIAFIGLGVMGYPMASNLRRKMDKEKALVICDVNQQAINSFQRDMEGFGPIEVVSNGYQAVQSSDVILTMLPDSPAVEKVYLDPSSGILAGIKAAANQCVVQKLIIECGTIESATIKCVAEETSHVTNSISKQSALDFVDAPVSGGPMGAQAGTLAFMVGTDQPDEVFPRVRDVLRPMANPKSIFLCGPVGAGTAFKVINNYLSAITSLAASEALNIGVKLGYDPKTLTEVINASGGQCWVTSKSNPVPGVQQNVPSSRNYEGGFRIELCKKVLGMGTELAKQAGARTILDQPTMAAFEEAAADERYKGKDARVVFKWLNESMR